jgi:gliding motility-associated-like protein
MKKIFALLVFLCGVLAMNAQVINLGASTQDSIRGCSYFVYDNGGINGDYSPNIDASVTIYSNSSANHAVRINLNVASFDVDCSDTVFIYDGPTINDNLLVALTNCSLEEVSSPTLSYAATVTNELGCLTIRFKTDSLGEGAGFAISTECTRPCQRINVDLDPITTKFPHLEDDGYRYMDVCPYDTIHFVAHGVFPDNDYGYHQDDASCTFHWDLGLDTFDIPGGSILDYTFPEVRGYDVAISIIDSAGCKSYIPYTFRVRASSNPIREVIDFPPVCLGSEVNLTVGYDLLSIVQTDTVGSEQATSLSVSDTIFLPDGKPCHNGQIQSGQLQYCSYKSPVNFTCFSPSATIRTANDLLFVRLKIEHSYIGDIWIRLICPNNNYVSIMKKFGTGSSDCSGQIPASEWGWSGGSNSSSAYFGIPVDDEASGNEACNPNNYENRMGTPWNYCWSNTTNQGYQYASEGGYVYRTANVHNNRVDSTNVAQMTNVYHPDGSFANLVGCPLNGEWSIEVLDGFGIDNGWITGWEIALDPSLLPQDWSYDVLVDSAWVSAPGAMGSTIVADTVGTITYTIKVRDEYGCIYDTVSQVEVVEPPKPHLGEDYQICYGDKTILDPHYVPGANEEVAYHWSTGDDTETIEVLTAGDYYVKVYSTDERGLTCDGSDTIRIGTYDRPVFNFPDSTMSGCAPLNVRIQNNSTPEGSSYEWYIMGFDEDGNMYVAYSSTQTSPTFQLNDPGVYSIKVIVTTPQGCVDSLYLWNYITVNTLPLVEFDADPWISMLSSENGGAVNFINYTDPSILTSGQGSFFWDFGDGTIDSSNFEGPHTYTTWGDFDVTLHVESTSGCASEITHTVVIEQSLIFPNVITPNGDGINDVFAIENLNTNINEEDPDAYRTNRLLIHDRWGNKVYDAKNYDTYAKDGTIYPGSKIFDGSGLSDGTYYYTFYYKGKAETTSYNGSLTIIR